MSFNVHKIDHFQCCFCEKIPQNIRDLMANYLKSIKKHMFDMPYINFKLYSNIVDPSKVDFDRPCLEREVVEADLRILKKVSMT